MTVPSYFYIIVLYPLHRCFVILSLLSLEYISLYSTFPPFFSFLSFLNNIRLKYLIIIAHYIYEDNVFHFLVLPMKTLHGVFFFFPDQINLTGKNRVGCCAKG